MSKIDEKLMQYEPINTAHAIVESIAFIQLQPDFSDEIIRMIIEAQNEIDALPKKEPITGFLAQIVRDENGHSFNMQTPRVVGQESKRFGSDASLQWMLRSTENAIAAHCLDYERWDDFAKTVEDYFSLIIHKILHENPIVVSFGLKVVDKFLFSGSPDNYNFEGLLNDSSPYIAKINKNVGDRWHCHTGWFENASHKNFEILNQLNIDAARGIARKKPSHITTIDHNVIIRLKGEDKHSETLRIGDMFNAESHYLEVS